MKRRLIIVAFLALSFSSFAEMRWTKSESNSPENLHEAKSSTLAKSTHV